MNPLPCLALSFHISLICMCLLQFNCFLLMPVVDKLPALLREDLESAFEDDLDNIFDITNLQHSLHLRKRDAEIELKRVFQWCLHFFLLDSQFWHSLLVWPMCYLPLQIKRLKDKFRQIHEQLRSHQLKSRPSMISTKWFLIRNDTGFNGQMCGITLLICSFSVEASPLCNSARKFKTNWVLI